MIDAWRRARQGAPKPMADLAEAVGAVASEAEAEVEAPEAEAIAVAGVREGVEPDQVGERLHRFVRGPGHMRR